MGVTWVEIEDAAGARLGALRNVTGWTMTLNRNAAGSFSFSIPASERAELAQLLRVARGYTSADGVLRELGAGVIETVRYVEGDAPTWQISGGSLLRELAYRSVDGLRLVDAVEDHPAECYVLRMYDEDDEHAEDRRELWAVLDGEIGDTISAEVLPGSSAHPLSGTDFNRAYLYVRHHQAFTGLRVTISSAPYATPIPAGDTTLAAEYWDATAEAWTSLSIEDGTDLVDYGVFGNTYHHTLAVSGAIRWEAPDGWGVAAGEATYKIRLYVEAGGVSSVSLADITVLYDGPTTDALLPVMAYAPPGWSLDAGHGYTTLGESQVVPENLAPGGGLGSVSEAGIPANLETLLPADTSAAVAEVDGVTALVLATANAGGETPIMQVGLLLAAGTAYRLRLRARGDGSSHGGWRLLATIGAVTWPLTGWRDVTSAATWTDYAYDFTTPNDCTSLTLALRGSETISPGVAFAGITVQTVYGGEMYQDFRDSSCLAGLVAVAEQSGEGFTESPSSRQVLWLGRDRRPAPVRAVGPMKALPEVENPQACAIVSLEREQAAFDLCSRVRAVGGGSGAERLTLAASSRTPPDGYAFDVSREWLINSTFEAAMGRRIEVVQEYTDIRPLNKSQTQRQFAANQLFDRALEYLANHSATSLDLVSGDAPAAYRLTLAGCREVLRPGWLLRTVWFRRVEGRWACRLDAELWIQSATITVDGNDVLTTAVEVATVPVAPRSEARLIADEIRASRQARAYG